MPNAALTIIGETNQKESRRRQNAQRVLNEFGKYHIIIGHRFMGKCKPDRRNRIYPRTLSSSATVPSHKCSWAMRNPLEFRIQYSGSTCIYAHWCANSKKYLH